MFPKLWADFEEIESDKVQLAHEFLCKIAKEYRLDG